MSGRFDKLARPDGLGRLNRPGGLAAMRKTALRKPLALVIDNATAHKMADLVESLIDISRRLDGIEAQPMPFGASSVNVGLPIKNTGSTSGFVEMADVIEKYVAADMGKRRGE